MNSAVEHVIGWLCELSSRRFYAFICAIFLFCSALGGFGALALAQRTESPSWQRQQDAQAAWERLSTRVLNQKAFLLQLSISVISMKPLAAQCTDLPVGERFAQHMAWQKGSRVNGEKAASWRVKGSLSFPQLVQLLSELAGCARLITLLELESKSETIAGQILLEGDGI
ncbi:hypothetical protein [Hafnia alvei]|uniref:Uncharacterized protein n=1 Tax=Hafnia alvei TaxID=569 RepID=A0A1C6Z343_HAFAL|nr:hypothetical protein [Hafnia alvei]NLS54728.1 hypothetical protein [Hafnia alvei]SCM53546.1 hypothetical protein BN1044_03041 [Hafnia alvei]